MSIRIACLHTAASNTAIFDAALSDFAEHIEITHLVRRDLLERASGTDGPSPQLLEETIQVLLGLTDDVDAVILTCSTLGLAAEIAASRSAKVVLRADAALARRACSLSPRVVALYVAPSSVEATSAVFNEAATRTGVALEILLVEGAWAAFTHRDLTRYARIVADAAGRISAGTAVTVALAQSSMAAALPLCTEPKPLAIPHVALEFALAKLNGTN